MKQPSTKRLERTRRPDARVRKGVITVLAAVLLATIFAFVAFAVDTGLIIMTQTDMQNAVDAAALAASQEITGAVQEAGEEGGEPIDANSIAVANARLVAEEVAEANGVYIDPDGDVFFGKRTYDEASDTWPIVWGAEPYNVVKVVARRDQSNVTEPDGEIKLAFGWAVGHDSVPVTVSAAAFVEARDIAMVLDYSGSMNYDSQFRGESLSTLGQTAIEANLADIWADLGSPSYGVLPYTPDYVTVPKTSADIRWRGSAVDITYNYTCSDVYLDYTSGGGQYFSGGSAGQTETFSGTGSYSGKMIEVAWVKKSGNWTSYDFYDSSTIEAALGLDTVPYPYPSGSWDNYIDYCRDSTGATSWYDYEIYQTGYRRKFGMMTLVEFWISKKKRFDQTPDLWQTRHYPFHAVKEGAGLLCEFLDDLEFGDHLGLVTYDTNSRIETGLNETGMPVVNLGSQLITDDYDAIDTIQSHKQAAHYGNTTNIGGGVDDAINLLTDHGRYGARPTIVLMTDGNANVKDPSWSLPAGWDWNTLTDYDGDGVADYSTGDSYKLYAVGKAKEAVDLGYTIHTLSVGANSDRDMMEAIAFIGGGIWIDVPGGSTVSEMEEQVLDAFSQIAAKVPPAKLVYTD